MFSFFYKHRVISAIVGLAVLIGAWYLFRPELLFINKSVNEAPPFDATAEPVDTGLSAATSESPLPLFKLVDAEPVP